MNKWTRIHLLLTATWLLLGTPGFARTNSTPHIYPNSVQTALQIETDLYNALDAKYRDRLQAPIPGVTTEEATAAVFMDKTTASKMHCEACVSSEFVNLINHVAHAKAIDRVQPGYFVRYMSGLALETATGSLPVAPEITKEAYWTDSILNDQASYFNQMIGMCIALNLSHHYFGQFDKYTTTMWPGRLIPINNLLTQREWEKDVRAATVNSLNCALGTEGAAALFDAIDSMPRRPTWTAYIVPQNTDIKGLNKQLGRYETDFFHGGLN